MEEGHAKIAHGILDSGELLLLDRTEDRQMLSKWLPFLRCAARRVTKNDFKDFLDFTGEDGTVSGDSLLDTLICSIPRRS